MESPLWVYEIAVVVAALALVLGSVHVACWWERRKNDRQ